MQCIIAQVRRFIPSKKLDLGLYGLILIKDNNYKLISMSLTKTEVCIHFSKGKVQIFKGKTIILDSSHQDLLIVNFVFLQPYPKNISFVEKRHKLEMT